VKLFDDNAVGGFVQESIDSYLVSAERPRETTRAGETHALPVGRVH